METHYLWFWVGLVVVVLVSAGVRDAWRIMAWQKGPVPRVSWLGMPIFGVLAAIAMLTIIAVLLFLVLTGSFEAIDLDDDHLYYMH